MFYLKTTHDFKCLDATKILKCRSIDIIQCCLIINRNSRFWSPFIPNLNSWLSLLSFSEPWNIPQTQNSNEEQWWIWRKSGKEKPVVDFLRNYLLIPKSSFSWGNFQGNVIEWWLLEFNLTPTLSGLGLCNFLGWTASMLSHGVWPTAVPSPELRLTSIRVYYMVAGAVTAPEL